MKEIFTREEIGEKMYFSTVNTDKFRTFRISVNLVVDLNRETVTENALVAFLLRKGCSMYPDFTALNLYLDELYGATISTDVRKFGDSQIVNVSGVCINDRFAIDGEKVCLQLAKLISSIITDPVLENGLFSQKEINVEKNVLFDTIRSIKDDKGAYVVEKLIENMCSDEPFGLAKYGYCEDAERLTPKRVTECYNAIMKNSRIEIVCSGENVDEDIKNVFVEAFSKIERSPITAKASTLTQSTDSPQTMVEKLNITQSKVAIGFTSTAPSSAKQALALSLMSAIYGGTTSSKLFLNVREKMSLCYYCASLFDRYKGIMIAYSGVQEENREKAIKEMLRQFEDVKNGSFTNQELEQAKASMITGLESVADSLYGLETWCLRQIFSGTAYTPEFEIEQLKKLTAEDVVNAATSVKLKMVYSIIEGGDRE